MEYGVSRYPLSSLFLTANEKDFSLPLEMTIRGYGVFEMTIRGKRYSRISLLPLEGGAPKRRRLAHAIG